MEIFRYRSIKNKLFVRLPLILIFVFGITFLFSYYNISQDSSLGSKEKIKENKEGQKNLPTVEKIKREHKPLKAAVQK